MGKLLVLLLLLPSYAWSQTSSALECSPQNDNNLSTNVSDIELVINQSFTTDLCTGYKEGTKNQPLLWADCCKMHDLRLWAGGTRKERRHVDKLLRQCVKDKGGKMHGLIMWLGVRIGSLSPIKIPGKQWGNGWGKKNRKKKLSDLEITKLEESLRKDSELSVDEIDSFIKELRDR